MEGRREMHLERRWEEPQGLHWKPGWNPLAKHLDSHTWESQVDLHYIFYFATKYNNGELRDFPGGPLLPIKGARVRFLVRRDPTCHGATKPCSTATEASTLEPTPSIKRSDHTEKPKHCSGKDPAQPEIKREFTEKVTLHSGGISNDMRHICHERRTQGNTGPGEESLLLNHTHNSVTAAARLKDRRLTGSPATNSSLASIHGHAQSARRKTCQPRGLDPEKLSFRNEGETKTLPDKANLREFISTSPAS